MKVPVIQIHWYSCCQHDIVMVTFVPFLLFVGHNILEEKDELVMKNKTEIAEKLQPQQKR